MQTLKDFLFSLHCGWRTFQFYTWIKVHTSPYLQSIVVGRLWRLIAPFQQTADVLIISTSVQLLVEANTVADFFRLFFFIYVSRHGFIFLQNISGVTVLAQRPLWSTDPVCTSSRHNDLLGNPKDLEGNGQLDWICLAERKLHKWWWVRSLSSFILFMVELSVL